MKREKMEIKKSESLASDLGFGSGEAYVLDMRADLMEQLCDALRAKQLTQSEIGRLLKVNQSRVSDLMKGKLSKFSLDMLITLAARARVSVAIQFGSQQAQNYAVTRLPTAVSPTSVSSGARYYFGPVQSAAVAAAKGIISKPVSTSVMGARVSASSQTAGRFIHA